MTYVSLSPSLHTTAEAAREYFRKAHGATAFVEEKPIDDDIGYCPTLSGKLHDLHVICVEVTDSAYSDSLDSFAADCITRALPVMLYIAIPPGLPANVVHLISVRCRKRGVGLLELRNGGGELLQPSLSLSLAGVRPIDPKLFPARMRQAISEAERTFKAGNPAKGCATLYDEIESLSRRLVRRVVKAGWWMGAAPKMNIDKDSWASILTSFSKHADWGKVKGSCPSLNELLIATLIGMTRVRNETGHKPRTRAALVKRDRELRTRFESAYDTLLELADATRPLRL